MVVVVVVEAAKFHMEHSGCLFLFFSLSRSNPSLGSRGESRRLSWRTSLIPRCLSRCHVTVSPIGEDRIEDRVFSIRLPLSLGNIARGYPCEPLPTKLDRPDPRFRPGVLPLFNPPRLFSSLFYSLWENIGRKSKGGRSIYIGCEVVRLAAFHPPSFLFFLAMETGDAWNRQTTRRASPLG